MAVQISPSILSADFARLADEAEAVAPAADWLHVDVMDNHFVPNLTLGLPVVQSLLKHTSLPVDCHLMIEDPDRWAPAYAEAGARNVTIHAEAVKAPVRTLREIRSAGARAGLAVNPGTTVEPYADLLPEIDMLLLMTVEPGFGGQRFLDLVLPKLRRARAMVAAHGGSVWLQVDGGVSEETIERCADAGADVFVAGAAVYSADDPAQAVRALRAQAERATAHAAWGKTQPRRASRPLRRPATRPSSAPLPCKPRPRLPKAPAPATPPTPAPIASCPRWSRPVTISPRRSRATVRGRAPEPPGARRRPPDPHLPGHRHRREHLSAAS